MLPRAAFAKYAGMRKAAVTKTLLHGRALKIEEAVRAAAFFSVVPAGIGPEGLAAISRLRAPRVRARAAQVLSAWAGERAAPAVVELLARGSAVQADQIVALCRAEAIDIPHLVAAGQVRRIGEPPKHGEPPSHGQLFAGLDEAARRWAEEAGAPVPYRLMGAAAAPERAGGEPSRAPVAVEHSAALAAAPSPPPARPSAPAPAPPPALPPVPPVPEHLALRLADDGGRTVLDGWCSVTVLGNQLSRRLRRGDRLLLASPQEPVRPGDRVAVFLKGGEGERALLGEVLQVSAERLLLQSEAGPEITLARAQVGEICRILALVF